MSTSISLLLTGVICSQLVCAQQETAPNRLEFLAIAPRTETKKFEPSPEMLRTPANSLELRLDAEYAFVRSDKTIVAIHNSLVRIANSELLKRAVDSLLGATFERRRKISELDSGIQDHVDQVLAYAPIIGLVKAADQSPESEIQLSPILSAAITDGGVSVRTTFRNGRWRATFTEAPSIDRPRTFFSTGDCSFTSTFAIDPLKLAELLTIFHNAAEKRSLSLRKEWMLRLERLKADDPEWLDLPRSDDSKPLSSLRGRFVEDMRDAIVDLFNASNQPIGSFMQNARARVDRKDIGITFYVVEENGSRNQISFSASSLQ